jgi:hypothetical protein
MLTIQMADIQQTDTPESTQTFHTPILRCRQEPVHRRPEMFRHQGPQPLNSRVLPAAHTKAEGMGRVCPHLLCLPSSLLPDQEAPEALTDSGAGCRWLQLVHPAGR